MRGRAPEPVFSGIFFWLPPPLPLSPELAEAGRGKKHAPDTSRYYRVSPSWVWVFVKVTCVSDLFSVCNMGEERRLTRGVRCSCVYLLSTLEDFVLSFITSDQFLKEKRKKANNKLWRLFLPFLLQKDSHGAARLLLRASVYFSSQRFFVYSSFHTVGEKNIEILCKKNIYI